MGETVGRFERRLFEKKAFRSQGVEKGLGIKSGVHPNFMPVGSIFFRVGGPASQADVVNTTTCETKKPG